MAGCTHPARNAAPTIEGGRTVVDHLDVPLEDSALMEEVELISTLMIAASANDERLDQDEIDRLLGLSGANVPEQQPGRSA